MKYLKNYKKYYNINENNNIIDIRGYLKETKNSINIILKNIFSIFPDYIDVEFLFYDSELEQISIDIYDYFTDIKDIVSLSEKELKIYAKNLDVLNHSNMVASIINSSYENKHKRSLQEDLNRCVKYLNNKNINKSKIYLDNLIRLIQIIQK